MRDLVDEHFSYKFCYVHFLPNSIIKGVAFVQILVAPLNYRDRQIFHMTKSIVKVVYNEGPLFKIAIQQIFATQIL